MPSCTCCSIDPGRCSFGAGPVLFRAPPEGSVPAPGDPVPGEEYWTLFGSDGVPGVPPGLPVGLFASFAVMSVDVPPAICSRGSVNTPVLPFPI